MSIVKVLLEHPNAKLPQKNNPTDACFDLFACEKVVLPAHSRAIVDVGLRMLIPEGWFVQFQPRSGFGIKNNVTPFQGVIDAGYSGTLNVMMQNDSDEEFVVEVGMKICQFTVERVHDQSLQCDAVTDEEWAKYIIGSHRGDKGLGSSNEV